MREIKAPNRFVGSPHPRIFLCGSIEMGAAENWQQRIVRELHSVSGTILNPRRDDWDSSWVQSIRNSQFVEQVEWELEAQERSDLILVNFDPATKSPITLLELGLFSEQEMIVCCPGGYWRKGNVDIVCRRYGIKQVDTAGVLIERAVEWRQAFMRRGQGF
jgi:hypothetical protein